MADSRERYNASAWTVAGLAITDPGDAGAIPVGAAATTDGTVGEGYCALVSAGAETRTIAAPTVINQGLSVWLDTAGGTVTVTVASTFDVANNNTLTFAEVEDYIRLKAITSGGTLRWAIADNAGVAVSTV